MLRGGVTVPKCSLGVLQWVCTSDIYIYIYIYKRNQKAVPNKRQPGDTPRTTNKQGTKALDHYGSSILATPHVSVNIVKMVY